MFKADPDLMPRYPFYKDEWNKISYADYQGSHPDQPPATWFVVFRLVQGSQPLTPKLFPKYGPLLGISQDMLSVSIPGSFTVCVIQI